MQQLAGVFLDVEPGDANLHPAAIGGLEADTAPGGERLIELRDLVTLRQIGIEIVLAGEDAGLMHGAPQREGAAYRQADRLGVGNR